MSDPRARARRLRRGGRLALVVLLALAAFGLGVALGQALEDNPPAGGTVTRVRTLTPLPLPPARETVTVTVEK